MSTASDDLELALAARRKVLRGQSVRWGGRQWNGASLSELDATIARMKREVRAEQRTAAGVDDGPATACFGSWC